MCRRRMKTAALVVVLNSVFFVTTSLLARPCSDGPTNVPRDEMCCITFTGEASGGTLIFYEYLGGKAKCATVETTAGEPAEKVISRLADVIEKTNPFNWIIVRGGPRETWKRVVTSSGGELRGLVGSCGVYMIAGTETGLGIPQPPHSLTANYNPEANRISLKWVNPSPDAYDYISINLHRGAGGTVPGNSESYVLDLNKYQADLKTNFDFYAKMLGDKGKIIEEDTRDDLKIWIFGVRNDIPSNTAAIHVNKNFQEELFGTPFTCGLATNWRSWSLDTNEKKIRLEEGRREGDTNVPANKYKPACTFDAKSFYQVINTGDKGGTGGVYRKFIGLIPGHTYRIKTRVATLSEPNEKNWSVSVYAAPNSPDGKNLSPRQMAGLDTLPAPSAEIKVGTAHPTGQFVEISTGKTVGGQEIKDITLPTGVDTITVWARCASSGALSAAIDWISLEDLSVQNP